MSASTARHEIRALLRAHLAAASAYRHLTRYCAVCHRLLRLAMESGGDGAAAPAAGPPTAPVGASTAPVGASTAAAGPPERPARPSTALPGPAAAAAHPSTAAGEARLRPGGDVGPPGETDEETRAPAPKRTGRPGKRTAEEWTGAERPSPT
ncbi:DUF6274 family protein [Streptomyces californicus]|uniref:DUF6274 family protein n=1 Tax=Streptomyces californicus TaxID=67351 RepID=UPI0037ADAA4F